MEAVVEVAAVEEKESRSGNTRWVLRDTEGKEYTTFRPRIGEAAHGFEGRRARIEFHEEQKGNFHNVYLDAIEPAPEEPQAGVEDEDADEVAWNTAVEAAPWLLGTREPGKPVPPDKLYEKLEPFKRRVADDIRAGGEEPPDS